MTSPFDPQGMSFEELLQLLDDTVGKLERNDLPLEEAIATYEHAVEIANACTALLDAAELRIDTIDAKAAGLPTESETEQISEELEH